MRLNLNNAGSVLLAMLLALGCTRELPLDNGDIEPKLVISCFLKADEPIDVVVSRSLGLLSDTSDYRIFDAKVALDFNRSFTAILESDGNGHYRTPLVPVESGVYTIRVSHPSFPNISGSDSLPEFPEVTFPDSIEYENGFPTMTLAVKDQPGPGYYAVRATGHNKILVRDSATGVVIDSLSQQKNLTLVNLEKIFDSDRDLTIKRLPFFTFTDQFFSGSTLVLTMRLLPEEMESSLFQTRVNRVTFEFSAISQSYYNFIRSYNHAKPIFGGPFGSFEPIFGNVNGGYGIIAGCARKSVNIPVIR